MNSEARVIVLLSDHVRSQMLTPEDLVRLEGTATVEFVHPDVSREELAAALAQADVCVTGWGSPSLDEEILDAAPRLRLMAHTAGSVRKVIRDDLVGSRLRVTHAAAVIAESVGEFVVGQILAGLRGIVDMDRRLRAGEDWAEIERSTHGRLLRTSTVGVVGASRTGQAVIRLLRAFGSEILVSDPAVAGDDVRALGATHVSLEDLLDRSDVVTIHAPLLPSTVGLIGREHLARLRDGALVVNSARGPLVDAAALDDELRSGRLRAALDVFDPEPLAPDSEWRNVPGAILTTHVAGHTIDGHHAQGAAIVDEIIRFLDGQPLTYEITAVMMKGMA